MHRMERFAARKMTTADGSEVDWLAVAVVLEKIVGEEDKDRPLTDEALAVELAKEGYKFERRTITKLRKRLGISALRQRSSCRTAAPQKPLPLSRHRPSLN